MANRPHTLIEGEYYHIYNRGNSRQAIFLDQQDYLVFQHFLYVMNMRKNIKSRDIKGEMYTCLRDDPLISIGAYCLMSNHFHLLVTQKSEKGISKFMQKLSTAYVMYFNQKYKRSGALFEGAFKSKHVIDDEYMKYLYSYIHLNPMKLADLQWKEAVRLRKKVDSTLVFEYHFSSSQDYLGRERIHKNILDMSSFPGYFQGPHEFKRNLEKWFLLEM